MSILSTGLTLVKDFSRKMPTIPSMSPTNNILTAGSGIASKIRDNYNSVISNAGSKIYAEQQFRQELGTAQKKIQNLQKETQEYKDKLVQVEKKIKELQAKKEDGSLSVWEGKVLRQNMVKKNELKNIISSRQGNLHTSLDTDTFYNQKKNPSSISVNSIDLTEDGFIDLSSADWTEVNKSSKKNFNIKRTDINTELKVQNNAQLKAQNTNKDLSKELSNAVKTPLNKNSTKLKTE